MRGVYIVIFFFILSFSQSYAQVETQYYQEGDTISFFQNVLFQMHKGTDSVLISKQKGRKIEHFNN